MGYYFIAVGGTGAKIVESLTHLCAAGLMPTDEKLYVMTVDPDLGNGNLARSSTSLNKYVNFQKVNPGVSQLFKTKVALADPFTWSPTDKGKNLDMIFSYSAIKQDPIAKLYEVLYTKNERNTLLDVGFRGHPSIGAAVMAQTIDLNDREWDEDDNDKDKEPWNTFKTKVLNEAGSNGCAKIFIAGSIFGGTGASGLPTIAKLLKQKFKSHCDAGRVMIGGGLMLPFFSFAASGSVNKEEVYALSENFLTNTQAALKYYSLKNSFETTFDSMYFIGDDNLSQIDKFSIGASEQENDSHIIELYAAFAAADFFNSNKENAKKYSFLSRTEKDKITWSDIPDTTKTRNQLGQFARFIFSYIHLIKPVLNDLKINTKNRHQHPWFIDYLQDLDLDNPEMSDQIKAFEDYAISFVRWITHIQVLNKSGNSGRGFKLFNSQLINPDSLSTINPEYFAETVIDEGSNVTINELWRRITSYKLKDNDAKDFGRFLRALYDCCERR